MARLTVDQNRISISGDVTFETVASLYQLLTAHVAEINADVILFDFSGVNSVNSAALALMIEASKFAINSQKKITFQSLPTKLTSLAQVCGVDKMLAL